MPQRHALVTGAAAGIGLAISKELVDAGVCVLLVDRSPDVLGVARSLRDSAGDSALGLECDVSDPEQVLSASAHALSRFGRVDILVNNAGINPKKDGGPMGLESTDLTTWNEVVATNLTAPFLFCRELVSPMRSNGWGRIVNISSRAGRTLSPLASTGYAATKAALLGFSRKLAAEVAQDGITVNCVAPGPIETALSHTASPERREALVRTVPAGRYGRAEEVAAAVSFLASERSAFTTGAVLDVNGGSFMP